jgi:hypothetical protein
VRLYIAGSSVAWFRTKKIEAEVKRLAVHQMYKLVSSLFGNQKMKTLTLPLDNISQIGA